MRTLAVAGFCIVAVVGAVAAFVFVGNGGGNEVAVLPTTGEYAPLTIPKPRLVRQGDLIINDPDATHQTWLSATMSPLQGSNRYALTITNASNIGYINSFEWYPPAGIRILRVIGSTSGHCALSGLTGFGGNQFKTVLLYPNILCDQLNLKPPTCTCKGDGGFMTVSFVLDKATGLAGSARGLSATPTLEAIPSFAK